MKFLTVIFLSCFLVFPAFAKPKIHVVDGDSIFIGRREIRLSGIDAPEYKQTCYDAEGKECFCGLEALRALEGFVNDSIECRKVATDRYHREVAVCYVNGEDLNEKMVASGWAVAYTRYSQDYKTAEKKARQAKLGIWQGRFMKPELYRSLHRKE